MLVWALDRHQKSAPYSEHLELADGSVRYCDSSGRTFSLPSYWARFETEKRTPDKGRQRLPLSATRAPEYDPSTEIVAVIYKAMVDAGLDKKHIAGFERNPRVTL